MATADRHDVWASGDAYEPYVGRWSRLVARKFLDWLSLPEGARWLDVGCGTGALTQAIVERCAPQEVVGVDPSEGYLASARERVEHSRVSFELGDAAALPVADDAFDAAVSGLVLNFVPDHDQATEAMARAVRPGGVVAGYVWDYAGKMELMRHFWDAAAALDPAAGALDEGVRFPVANPTSLSDLFCRAGLSRVETRAIDVPTVFRDFDDYWSPFLGGQAPAPGYCMSLSEDRRAALRDRIRKNLPSRSDGSIHLIARAWAVRGVTPS